MPSTLDWNTSDPKSWMNYPVILATQWGLTSLSDSNEVLPGIAKSWQRQALPSGGEQYRFDLREDVRWSNGASVTAYDFELGWRRGVVGRERGAFSDIVGAKEVSALLERGAPAEAVAEAVNAIAAHAVDDHTFEVRVDRPCGYLLSRLANVYVFFPAPSAEVAGMTGDQASDYFDRPEHDRPPGVGPFRLKEWDQAGERLVLAPNPLSAFAPKAGEREPPAPDVVLFKSEIGEALFDRGRIDFVFVDSPVALKQEKWTDLVRQELLSTYFLAFNTQRSPLDDRVTRTAIAQALDRPALLMGLLPAARPALTLLPPGLPGSTAPSALRGLPGQTRRYPALNRIRSATLRPLRLIFSARESFIPEVAIAERIQAQLLAAGFTVEIEPRSDFYEELARIGPDGKRTWDLYLKRVGADYAHPETFFSLFRPGGNHLTGWEGLEEGRAVARFLALLDRAEQETDPAKAGTWFGLAQEILLAEQVVISPIYHPDRYYRVSPRLAGLVVDPFNFLSLRRLRLSAP